MEDRKAAAPQKSRQPQHLVHAARRIETAFGIKLADLHRRSRQSFEQRSACTKAAERNVVMCGVQPCGELDGLDFRPAHIQGINEVKDFSPGSCFRMCGVSPDWRSH